jgi:frataxin-like iron-binding protein CyaY
MTLSDAELTCDAITFHRECDEMLDRLNDAVDCHAVPAADARGVDIDVSIESGVLTIALGAP